MSINEVMFLRMPGSLLAQIDKMGQLAANICDFVLTLSHVTCIRKGELQCDSDHVMTMIKAPANNITTMWWW